MLDNNTKVIQFKNHFHRHIKRGWDISKIYTADREWTEKPISKSCIKINRNRGVGSKWENKYLTE